MFVRLLAVPLLVLGILGALISVGSAQPDSAEKGKQEKKAEPDDFFKKMANGKDHFLMSDMGRLPAPHDGMDPLYEFLTEQRTPADAKITLEKYLLYKEKVAARWGELKFGEKRSEELTIYGHRTPSGMTRPDGGPLMQYCVDLPVSLKAGQNIVIQTTVVGEGRTVALQLTDPAGEKFRAAYSPRDCKLVIREANASGIYKIRVSSSHIGPFSLTVFERTADIKALEAKIEQLERELAESRAKLQELLPRK